MDGGGTFGVDRREFFVQLFFAAFPRRDLLIGIEKGRVAFRYADKRCAGQTVDIQSRPADKERDFPPRDDFFRRAECRLAVIRDGKRIGGVEDIDHVMRHAEHLVFSDFRRADVHAAIELHGVAGDDLTAEPPCDADGERGLARRRRTAESDRPDHRTALSVHSMMSRNTSSRFVSLWSSWRAPS